jgi:hypothetical protein
MKRAFAAVALLGLACCSKTTPPPNAGLSSAGEMVQTAWAAGADDDTVAADRMRRARAEIDRAVQLMHEGKNEDATRMLARAHADAELALALGRERAMHRRVREGHALVEAAREGK